MTGEEKAIKEALAQLLDLGWRVTEEDCEIERCDDELIVIYPDAYWGEGNDDARVEVKIKEVK